jgi:hypothetical protein
MDWDDSRNAIFSKSEECMQVGHPIVLINHDWVVENFLIPPIVMKCVDDGTSTKCLRPRSRTRRFRRIR